jgi:hypothetical protein
MRVRPEPARKSVLGRLPQIHGHDARRLRSELHRLYGHDARLLYAGPNATPAPIADLSAFCRAKQITRFFVAGLFNSGTNFASALLRQSNCMRTSGEKVALDVSWQVSYYSSLHGDSSGKHTYLPATRPGGNYIHPVAWTHSTADCPGCAVLVIVRHPLPWMAAQCAHAYACKADWRGPCRCERRSQLHDTSTDLPFCLSDVLRRPVSCSDNRGHQHSHFPALWADWHKAYADAGDRRPRIFVRYEDLLLRPRSVLSALCPCIGATPASSLSSVDLNVAPERGGLKQAQSVESRHLAVQELLGSFSTDELWSIAAELDPWLGGFGYRIPLHNRSGNKI